MPKYLLLKYYRGGPEPHHRFRRWISGRRRTWRRAFAFQRHVADCFYAPEATMLAGVDIGEGVPDEFMAASTKVSGADQMTAFEAKVRSSGISAPDP